MDRYNANKNDPYLILGTDCLKNRLGIHNLAELSNAERISTRRSIQNIQKQCGPYSLNTLVYIHTTLFSEIYEWAGEIRTVGIWKGNTQFCVPERIEIEAARLFELLNSDFSVIGKRWSLTEAADKLAFHYGEINMLHPFREGNGRTQRILFEFIAEDIGLSIRWLEDADEWLEANVSAFTTDHNKLREIFLDMLEPI